MSFQMGWKQIVKISTDDVKKQYDKLNVDFDLWYGESDADEYVDTVIDYLKEKGLTRESEGALIIDVSNEDDTTEIPPLLLVKSNGAVACFVHETGQRGLLHLEN